MAPSKRKPSRKGKKARRVSKKDLRDRVWAAVIASSAAGLVIVGTLALVRSGIESGGHLKIPLLVLAINVVLLWVAIWSVIKLSRALRKMA
jgi:hypothetical protein